jgi:membrane protein
VHPAQKANDAASSVIVVHVGDGEQATRSGRIKSAQDWLSGRADTSWGRLGLQWFRGYFAASRNSGCAVTIYASLSVLPAVLVAIAYFHPSQSDANLFAERLITHLKLNDATASLVHDAFGSASANALGASIAVAISFLLWGIGIGQIYHEVYARAWGIKVGSAADQALFAIFFFVLSGAIALAVYSAAGLRHRGWLVLVPVWMIGSTVFWLWVPRFLLHREIGLRALLPGALLSSIVVGGTVATSPLFLAAPMNQNGKTFGSFGVALTIIAYVFVMMTMSLVCAVFSPRCGPSGGRARSSELRV